VKPHSIQQKFRFAFAEKRIWLWPGVAGVASYPVGLLCEGSHRNFSFRRTRKICCRVWGEEYCCRARPV